jgi:hypothetical protein
MKGYHPEVGQQAETGGDRFWKLIGLNVRVGSKGELLAASRCFPLWSQQRTSFNGVDMSVWRQEPTFLIVGEATE